MGQGGMGQAEVRQWLLRQWAAREVAAMWERIEGHAAEAFERHASDLRSGRHEARRGMGAAG